MMLGLLKSKTGPRLTAEGLVLRLPNKSHFAQLSALRHDSKAFLKPFVPKWSERDFSRASFAQRVKNCAEAANKRTEFAFFIFSVSENESGKNVETLVGGITLSNIRYGAVHHANIGYWLGQSHTGKNYMGGAVSLCLEFAFNKLHLRRVHAACMPHNQPSINVLTKSGFVQEGFAQQYLQIDGEYRDHLLFGLTRDKYTADMSR